MTDKTEKMKAMLVNMDKMTLAAPKEADRIKNTDARRKKLLHFIHCLHILRLDGSVQVNDRHEMLAVEELKSKLSRCADREKLRNESIGLSIINDHTHTWYIARNYYEKCSKILCQMMVTIMDCMFEAETGNSLLYTPEEKKVHAGMEQELELLSKLFRESYYYMCVYDYFTERLAEYVKMKEYELLIPEHRRIVKNGLPARLQRIAAAYCSLNGNPDILKDEAVKNPEILYNENILAKLYEREVQKYPHIDFAMNNYQNMVAETASVYTSEMEEKRGG